MVKVEEKVWTVARFPNGSWSYGGRPDDPDYECCEVFQIPASSHQEATRKAKSKRSYQQRKAKLEAERQAKAGTTQE